MLKFRITAHFDRGYIADPYWPEREKLINIQKTSGMNRAKSPANRRKALEEYLTGATLTLADYEQLEKLASRPFYTNGSGAIIIPEIHVVSFMVATCDQARAATRPCDPGQVRSRFIMSHWDTGKDGDDGVWTRFAVISAGTGQKLSNQRGLRENKFISNFDGTGTITFDP